MVFAFIRRVFLALADDAKDRGMICAHGGGKVSDRHNRLMRSSVLELSLFPIASLTFDVLPLSNQRVSDCLNL